MLGKGLCGGGVAERTVEQLRGQVIGLENGAFPDGVGLGEHIAQLPHVARPRLTLQ